MNGKQARMWTAQRHTTAALMQSSGGTGWVFGPEVAWQMRAACAKAEEPNQFFPGGGRPSNRGKALCAGCPVRVECLDWALVHEEEGIWGGMTEAERDKLLLSSLPLSITRESK